MTKTEKIKAKLAGHIVITEKSNQAANLYSKSRFGEPEGKEIYYSFTEALYLLEKKKLEIFDKKDKKLKKEDFIKKAKNKEKDFLIKYVVFKDMRDRGYIIKTALKFGADFRVYDRGVKPGQDHAKWILSPTHESQKLTWHEFSAKNRVAHSTKKKLLLGIVDNEGDVSYWESSWTRP